MIFWSLFCFWLAVGFSSELLGLFAHEFNLAASVVLLIAAALFYFPAGRTSAVGDGWGIAAAVAGLLVLPVSTALAPFAAGLALWGIDAAVNGRRFMVTRYGFHLVPPALVPDTFAVEGFPSLKLLNCQIVAVQRCQRGTIPQVHGHVWNNYACL